VSKNLEEVFELALSDDYTYKLMTEELVGLDLPDFRGHKWERVYKFFIGEPLVREKINLSEKRRCGSLTRLEQKLEDALFSDDTILVKIALLSGVNPRVRNSDAMYKAILYNVPDVVEILLDDGRIDPNVFVNQAIRSYNLGVIKLFLRDERVQ
jgi:hypothetical protein